MVFGKVADVRTPVTIEVEDVSGGRTFTTSGVRATQPGRACGIGTLLPDSTAPNLIRHRAAPPAVPGPYESTPYDTSIPDALRPHAGIGQNQAHRTTSTAITISMLADVRVDQWLLYHHESTFAGDGMTHTKCRVEDGRIVASFAVEAMVRGFADPRLANDEKTAL